MIEYMMIPRAVLDHIAAGTVTVAFRRWRRARVRPGTRLRTAIGLVEIQSVRVVSLDEISEDDARMAGSATRDELLAFLAGREGDVYRIELRPAGADPRIALRANDRLTDGELADIRARLARMDQSAKYGPWTVAILRLIAEHPAVRAPDLAARLGWETQAFKRHVRKLKELGLTESLEVGYRISPRGQVVLTHLDARDNAGDNE
jgi:hypothetical protein